MGQALDCLAARWHTRIGATVFHRWQSALQEAKALRTTCHAQGHTARRQQMQAETQVVWFPLV